MSVVITVLDVLVSGLIAISEGACLDGWTRIAALDDTFLRGAATYGGTGGNNTTPDHVHAENYTTDNVGSDHEDVHDQTGPSTTIDLESGALYYGGDEHTHTLTGTGTPNPGTHVHTLSGNLGNPDSGDNRPVYTTVIFCEKD